MFETLDKTEIKSLTTKRCEAKAAKIIKKELSWLKTLDSGAHKPELMWQPALWQKA